MDRLEAMSILLAVVDAGSLSAGARQLKAPLATVSRKVAELERHLGAPLVIRTRRGLSLTEEGRAYVAASRRILDDVETAERDVSGDGLGPRGTLHVTAPIVFGERHVLPQTLAFMQAQPEITVRLALVDQQVSLSEDHVDVAVRIGHLLDSALIATRVGSVRRVVCASPDYLARRGVPAQPSDLAHHDGISFQGFATAPEWRYRRDSAAFTVEPRPRLSVNTTDAAIQAAVAGIGILRVLSYQVADQLSSGELVELLPDFAPDPLPVHALHRPLDPLPSKIRAFLDWVVPRLRAQDAF